MRERQLKEKPTRFTTMADSGSSVKIFGWKQIDFKDWQTVPDGAIFLIDECHNDMPRAKRIRTT